MDQSTTRAHLKALPSAKMYETSYLHDDEVTHVAASTVGFFISGSKDGHLKIWKKKAIGIQLEKDIQAHDGPIEGLAVSGDGTRCCTISNEKCVKIYDVLSCDMVAQICLDFVPGCVEWVNNPLAIAISDRESPSVHIYDASSDSGVSMISREITSFPIIAMKYNHAQDTLISADAKGFIDYWDPSSLKFQENGITFKFKSDTDLFDILKTKTTVSSIEVSPDGMQFSVTSHDRRIRVFWYRTGKLRCSCDESLEVAPNLESLDTEMDRARGLNFECRLNVEKKFQDTKDAPQPNAVFDASSNFLLFSTFLGIKVVNLHTGNVSRVLGKMEKNNRFLRIALYQSQPFKDPTLMCCAFKRDRVYLFSKREEHDGLGDLSYALMQELYGDIHIRLYPNTCPRAVEIFTRECRSCFYEDFGAALDFIPEGVRIRYAKHARSRDDTGGLPTSGDGEDKSKKRLRHDRPFRVSMSHSGEVPFGHEIIITTMAAPWLDEDYTVIGTVFGTGKNVIKAKHEELKPPRGEVLKPLGKWAPQQFYFELLGSDLDSDSDDSS